MDITNFKTSNDLSAEVFINVEVETYDIGYSVEDCDIQVKSYLDRDNLRIVADFSVSVKVVSDKDRSRFIIFKYEDSTAPYVVRSLYTKLTSRLVEDHNLDEREFEELFGGAIDDLGLLNVKLE